MSRRKVARILEIRERIKELYEEQDELLVELMKNPEKEYKVGDKYYRLKNNFTTSNVAFKAMAFREFELTEVKK